MPAPIAFFVYRRPAHAARTLSCLAQCQTFRARELHVFSDGPRSSDDAPAVSEVRRIVETVDHPHLVLHVAPSNRGLAASVIAGVTALCASHGAAVVVEDDLLVDPLFLDFMDGGLERYADVPTVMQIAGFTPPVAELAGRRTSMLLPFITSWGWATWADRWRHFDPNAAGAEIMLADPARRRAFNAPGLFDWAAMLEAQAEGRTDSWAIRWYWTVFNRSGLALYPPTSLVRNGGMDGSGTHGNRLVHDFLQVGSRRATTLPDFPAEIERSDDVMTIMERLYRHSWRGRLLQSARTVKGLLSRRSR